MKIEIIDISMRDYTQGWRPSIRLLPDANDFEQQRDEKFDGNQRRMMRCDRDRPKLEELEKKLDLIWQGEGQWMRKARML